MDIENLVVFAVVAREGSFTKAAAVMGVSQPSISERMQRLERQLRTPVFVRRGRGVGGGLVGGGESPRGGVLARRGKTQKFEEKRRGLGWNFVVANPGEGGDP